MNGQPNRPLSQEYDGRVLTVQEVAEILHVDDSTVRRLINEGMLDILSIPISPGGRKRLLRIKGRSVDRIINGQE